MDRLFHEFKATIPATCKVLEASTLWQPRTQQDSEPLVNTPTSIYKAPHCRAKEEMSLLIAIAGMTFALGLRVLITSR
jgi:hypothetical protein